MSSGAFLRSKYTDDNLVVRGIRIQPETLTLTLNAVANTAPTGAVTATTRAKVSGGRRSYGCHARTVTIVMTAAGGGLAIGSKITLPWLSASTFGAIAPDQAGTYQTFACAVVGKTAEKQK